MYDMIKM